VVVPLQNGGIHLTREDGTFRPSLVTIQSATKFVSVAMPNGRSCSSRAQPREDCGMDVKLMTIHELLTEQEAFYAFTQSCGMSYLNEKGLRRFDQLKDEIATRMQQLAEQRHEQAG
jgi:hypothetical protein